MYKVTNSTLYLSLVISLPSAPNPPRNFMITVEGATTLTFSWDPPDPENGTPESYVLTCDPEMEGIPSPAGFPRTIPAGDPPVSVTVTLSVFRPGVTYNCGVFASNDAGDSVSVTDSATTLEAGVLLTHILNVE